MTRVALKTTTMWKGAGQTLETVRRPVYKADWTSSECLRSSCMAPSSDAGVVVVVVTSSVVDVAETATADSGSAAAAVHVAVAKEDVRKRCVECSRCPEEPGRTMHRRAIPLQPPQ